jgi:hypothetical protein
MNAEETEIYEFLKGRVNNYVSATEISKFLGRGRRFQKDRNWATPILRRMEVDGIVESNPYGEYRVKGEETQTSDFKEALHKPGVSLGDTTIIRIQDAA